MHFKTHLCRRVSPYILEIFGQEDAHVRVRLSAKSGELQVGRQRLVSLSANVEEEIGQNYTHL